MEELTRMTVPLSNAEKQALIRIAEAELRHPRDQARVMLRRALGLTNDEETGQGANQVPVSSVRTA